MLHPTCLRPIVPAFRDHATFWNKFSSEVQLINLQFPAMWWSFKHFLFYSICGKIERTKRIAYYSPILTTTRCLLSQHARIFEEKESLNDITLLLHCYLTRAERYDKNPCECARVIVKRGVEKSNKIWLTTHTPSAFHLWFDHERALTQPCSQDFRHPWWVCEIHIEPCRGRIK